MLFVMSLGGGRGWKCETWVENLRGRGLFSFHAEERRRRGTRLHINRRKNKFRIYLFDFKFVAFTIVFYGRETSIVINRVDWVLKDAVTDTEEVKCLIL
tara:strand:- start:1083 stop:1379 length:297 start_codon:yes stop_codon:yes gene_type:complete